MSIYKAKEVQAGYADIKQPDMISLYSTCAIQGSNGWAYRTYLQHDLSGIPVGSRILSAKLRMYEHSKNDNGDLGTTNIGRVIAEWNEKTICSNNKPGYEGRYLAEDVPPPGVGNWTDWDVTTLVQEWVDGIYPNYGLMIINNNESAWRYNWTIRNRRYTEMYGEGDFATYMEIDYLANTEDGYKISTDRMVDFANEVRRLKGSSEELSPSQILIELASINTLESIPNASEVSF